MATNILDAFVITFGLDTSRFKSGEREIREGSKRLRDDSKKTFDDMEKRGKSAGQTFRSVRNEVAGLLLTFAGARSIGDFASNLLNGEAAAGRLSETLGVATGKLVAWQEASRQVGGQAGDADSALQRIMSAIQQRNLTGSSGIDADLVGLGINKGDMDVGDPSRILLKMAAAGEKMAKPEFAARLQRIGLPQSTIYLLEQGRQKLEAQLDESEKLANVTDKDAKEAQKLNAELAKLGTTIRGTVRPWLTSLIEGFLQLTDNGKALNALMPFVAGGIAAIGIAATAAYWPVAVLTVALGSLIIAYKDWQRLRHMTPEQRAQFEKKGEWLRDQAWGKLKSGDITGALGTIGKGFVDRIMGDDSIPGQGGGGSPQARTPGAGGSIGGTSGDGIERALIAGGLTPEQARGARAGIHGEGGGRAIAANGAFGIGQWRGARAKRLFARFGRNPTLSQQIQFLLWELHGGDSGGASVMSQSTADGAMVAYFRDFMRPQGAKNEHWKDLVGDVRRGRAFLAKHGGRGGPVNVGPITIQTRATDAQGIARSLGGALKQRGIIAQADAGIAP